MEISYLGHSSFKLKGKNGLVVTDPFDPKMVGLKYSGVTGDVVTISHNHDDHNKADLVKETKKVFDGPGEYEVMGISIIGIKVFHDTKKGEERGENIIFVYEIDDIRIAHLGDLGHKLSEKIIEEIGEIDILLIPVGGFYTIDAKEAVETVSAIEPKIIIPMHFKVPGMNEEVFGKLETTDPFLKQIGLPVENLPKLSIKKLELGEEQKVVVLEVKQ